MNIILIFDKNNKEFHIFIISQKPYRENFMKEYVFSIR